MKKNCRAALFRNINEHLFLTLKSSWTCLDFQIYTEPRRSEYQLFLYKRLNRLRILFEITLRIEFRNLC